VADGRTSVYEAAGGADGLLALSHAWHERCLADELAAHPFEHPGHPQHTERLAAYWGEALGGPAAYTSGLGDETLVSRMHAGNGEHPDLDAAAVACFDQALTDVGLTEEPLRSVLHDYFAWNTERLSRHPGSPDTVPDGLAVPHWSWGGPVG
jgi:hemoglobin